VRSSSASVVWQRACHSRTAAIFSARIYLERGRLPGEWGITPGPCSVGGTIKVACSLNVGSTGRSRQMQLLVRRKAWLPRRVCDGVVMWFATATCIGRHKANGHVEQTDPKSVNGAVVFAADVHDAH
jgi:hypothetical protein